MYFKQFKLFNDPGVIVKEIIKDLKPDYRHFKSTGNGTFIHRTHQIDRG
jgi:hypothetical protein